MEFNQFLEKVKNDFSAAGVELVIAPGNRVYYQKTCCNGYFESEYPIELTKETILNPMAIDVELSGKTKKVLAASSGGKNEFDFFSLLAHEYSHMCQYIEKSPYWMSTQEFLIWEDWLSNKNNKKDIKEIIPIWEKVVMLEADCEQRVIKLIDELNLNISKEQYSQKANSYLYFYHWALEKQSWYNKAPYEVPEIVNAMPKELFAKPQDYTIKNLMDSQMFSLFNSCE